MVYLSRQSVVFCVLLGLFATTSTAVQPPPCSDDASRTIFAGATHAPCKKFHGDQATCESAYYMNQSGEAASCGFVAGTCVGCGGRNLVCPVNTCDGTANGLSDLVCDGDPGRSAMLGLGGNGQRRCRNLDNTDQGTCENAYYHDESRDHGEPIACFWESVSGSCMGCAGGSGSADSSCPSNACDPLAEVADAPCPQDTERTNLLGFGGNDSRACRRLDDTDQATCENAYYEDRDSGVGVACWWDGGDCRGSGFDDFFGWNECLSSVAPPTASATCAMDPGRTNLVGFGNNDTAPCRSLDGTSRATCENSFYEDVRTGDGVACWWNGTDCRGSLDDYSFQNACARSVVPASVTCEDGRTGLLGFGGDDQEVCRGLDGTDQPTCENSYYQSFPGGFAVACAWNGTDAECRGCGGRNEDCAVNACVAQECAGDPGRSNFIGFGSIARGLGQNGGSCRQYDGDETTCENSWYMSRRRGRGVGCWWDGAECRGSTRRQGGDDACRVDSAECALGGRNTLLGFGGGGQSPCRVFDGVEAMCDDAFYEDEREGFPVACWFSTGLCLGSGGQFDQQNACVLDPIGPDATCLGDPNRTISVGFGNAGNASLGNAGAACHSLDSAGAAMCNMAFYENIGSGAGVACWWDGFTCNGSSSDNSNEDACRGGAVATPVTCTLDADRTTQIGRGGNGSRPCRVLDGTSEAVCEDTYYISDEGPIPVACWWDGDECRGTSGRFFFHNECLYDEPPLVADAVCGGGARSVLLGFGSFDESNDGARTCRALDDETVCENAYYQSFDSGFGVACWWDGSNCRGSGDDNADENVCLPDAECTLDPGRTTVLGFGENNTAVCRQLDGDQTMCENSFYVESDSGDAVACWWDDGDCRGSNDANSRLNSCLRTPQPATATCAARSVLLGFGETGSGRRGGACRQFDGDQAMCETAFYESADDYVPVACVWNVATDFCLGTSNYDSLNACLADAEPPTCPRDPTRTVFAGRGNKNSFGRSSGGSCRQFSDQPTCEMAFYVNKQDEPIACRWSGNCGGSRNQSEFNTCLTGGFTCDGRTTVVGGQGQGACRDLASTTEMQCEDAFYIGFRGRVPIACSWDAATQDCRGCGRNRNENSFCDVNVCSPLACDGDASRTTRIGQCRQIDTQGECEAAWHITGGPTIDPFAASCAWNAEEERCFGCGVPSQSGRECVDTCAVGCGNGVVETGESCDDGNMFDGDCCDSSCQLEPNGSACTDRLFCSEGAGACQAGACVGAVPRICGSCIADDCNEFDNACDDRDRGGGGRAVGAQLQGIPGPGPGPDPMSMPIPEPEGTECDDGLDGTAASACDANGMCVELVLVPPTPTPTPIGQGAVVPAPAVGGWGYGLMLLSLLGLSLAALRRRDTE